MSFSLFTTTTTAATTLSPLRQYYNPSGKGVIRPLPTLCVRKPSLFYTSCELKQNKEGNKGKDQNMIHIDRRNVLIGLGSLCVAAASTVLDKGLIANAGYATIRPQPFLENENEDEDEDAATMQTVSEFGSNPRPLNEPIRALVERQKKKDEDEEEILIVYGISIPNNDAARFDVYVDSPVVGDGGVIMADSKDYGEMAGSMVDLAHTRVGRNGPNGTLELGITDLIEDIEAEESKKLVVTLVPRSGQLIIGGVRIENWDDEE